MLISFLSILSFDEEEDWESEMRESEEAFADLHTDDFSEKRSSKDSYFSENAGLSSSQPRQCYERHTTVYLPLEIPMEKIYFIDDYKSLRECQRAISKVCMHGCIKGWCTANIREVRSDISSVGPSSGHVSL